ncbi:PC-esterase domain-containing protein 1A-like isoform X1 [Bacillus rossius redtenbacheri]
MNSCLWDLSRWGPNGVCAYKDNLLKLMKFLNQNLPQETLFIWTTALPISQNCYGGFLIKQVEFLKHTLRFEVMEANMYARDVVANHGYDVLDLHYYFTMQIFRRAKDGIHWLPEAVRFMTNLVLTHTALSWHHPLPGNVVNSLLDEALRLDNEEMSDIQLPELPPALDAFSKTSKEPDGVVSGRKSQVHVATRPAVGMQKKPARKRKASNRPNMKRQQCQALLVDPWINASHTPHPFGDPAAAADLMLFDQQVHDFFTHQRMPHHVSQMGRPAESYTSSELEQFEWEHY